MGSDWVLHVEIIRLLDGEAIRSRLEKAILAYKEAIRIKVRVG